MRRRLSHLVVSCLAVIFLGSVFSCGGGGGGKGGGSGIEGPAVGRLVSQTIWQVSPDVLASITPEDEQALEDAGIRLEGDKLIGPQRGLAGRWIKVGNTHTMTDENGDFRIPFLAAGVNEAQVFRSPLHAQAEASFPTSHIVPEGSTPQAFVVTYNITDPGEMNPGETELAALDTRQSSCAERDVTHCAMGDNGGACCQDFNGPFGDGQPYFRDPTTPICLAKSLQNFLRSTCYNWSFSVINAAETEGGDDCINEAAFTAGQGPGCWRNHKYRNCQNMNRKEFFVNGSDAGTTLEVEPGASITFTITNNTPWNGTALIPDDVEMPGEFSVVFGSIFFEDEFFVLEHFDDDEEIHYEEMVVTYTAPASLPGGATSATFTLAAQAFGHEIPITIKVGESDLQNCSPSEVSIAGTPGFKTDPSLVTGSGDGASATAKLMSIEVQAKGSLTAGAPSASARATDYIQFDAPGKTGQAVEGTAVFNITLQKGGASSGWDWHGFGIFNQLTDEGDPTGTVTVPLRGFYGLAWPAEISAGVTGFIGQESDMSVKIEFVRFEGLPEGTTIRSCNSHTWMNPPPE